MSLNYTTLQAWILARAVRPELTTEVVTFIREAEAMIRREVEALEVRVTLLEADRSSGGIYNLSGNVREVRAAYAVDRGGQSYALNNAGVSGIRRLRDDADVYEYAIVGQTIEFRGVPGTDADLSLVVIGWPAPLATTATNALLDNNEDLYTYGALGALYEYSQDIELADRALAKFAKAAADLNKVTRRRIGGASVLPAYNFGQTRVGRGR
jgi:hypothetical protein